MTHLESSSSNSSAATVEPWFQDVSTPLETVDGKPRWDVPPAPLVNKIIMLIAVGLPIAGVIWGVALSWQHGFMGWLYLAMMLGGWWITGLGVTIGFHRLLTHRSFETQPWLRFLFTLMGTMSIEGSPLLWCATHRRHHEVSDQPGDPHSPHTYGQTGWWDTFKGFIHAHFGWLFTGYYFVATPHRYVPDMLNDKMVMWFDRYYFHVIAFSMALPALIGGLATMSWQGAALGFLWGGLVRVFITHHVTWSVNSVCHMFGSQEFDSYDDSRNNAVVGILALGEGWHNNHHAFPTSAKHGLRWWQFDISWCIIRTLQMLGLAWNIKQPTAKHLENKLLAK